MKNISDSVKGCKPISHLNIISITLVLLVSILGTGLVRADVVNINKADAEALQENLKGVGEVKSEAIIEYRKKHGRYKSIEDLKDVPGIGDELVRKNRGNMSLTRGLERARERHEINEERRSSMRDRKESRSGDGDDDDDEYKKNRKSKYNDDEVDDKKDKKGKKHKKDKKDKKKKKDKKNNKKDKKKKSDRKKS